MVLTVWLDLGQGYPDFTGSVVARERVVATMTAEAADSFKLHQYAPVVGNTSLLESLSRYYEAQYGSSFDPATEACVTTSGTEALYCAIQV